MRRLGASPRYAVSLDNRILDVFVEETEKGYRILISGVPYDVETVRPARSRRGAGTDESDHLEGGKWTLRAPLTGAVIDIQVAVGAKVEAGDVLMTLEAMKMQNELKARVGGSVTALHVSRGQRVEGGAPLIEVTAPEETPAPDP